MTHQRDAIDNLLGALIALCFTVVVIVVASAFATHDDCARGSITASGIARCR